MTRIPPNKSPASCKRASRCPDRDYYIVDNKHFQEIRQQYIEHVTKMFALAGDSPDQAAKEAASVMEIETALAKASTARVDLRIPEKTYHIYTVADFQKLAPDFDFTIYFKAVKVRPVRHPQCRHAGFLQGLERADRQRAGRRVEVLPPLASDSCLGHQLAQGFLR